VPWYGYDYTCINANGNLSIAHCEIAAVPFRGVQCSDAAGSQYPFGVIMHNYRNVSIEKTVMVVNTTSEGGGLWSRFNYKDSAGAVHAVWFDSPQVLAQKYDIAKSKGIRGLSMWNVDCLSDAAAGPGAEDTLEMWSVMDNFFVSSQ
jgi:di-N-acetylchitobiase